MFALFKNFIHGESGVVTVDWIIISACVVGIAVGGVSAAQTAVVELGGTVEHSVTVENGN